MSYLKISVILKQISLFFFISNFSLFYENFLCLNQIINSSIILFFLLSFKAGLLDIIFGFNIWWRFLFFLSIFILMLDLFWLYFDLLTLFSRPHLYFFFWLASIFRFCIERFGLYFFCIHLFYTFLFFF